MGAAVRRARSCTPQVKEPFKAARSYDFDRGLLHPLVQRLGRAADFCGDRHDRRPERVVLAFMVQHRPHRAVAHLRREPVRRFALGTSPYSGVEASGKPGAAQSGPSWMRPTLRSSASSPAPTSRSIAPSRRGALGYGSGLETSRGWREADASGPGLEGGPHSTRLPVVEDASACIQVVRSFSRIAFMSDAHLSPVRRSARVSSA